MTGSAAKCTSGLSLSVLQIRSSRVRLHHSWRCCTEGGTESYRQRSDSQLYTLGRSPGTGQSKCLF